jgi:hypothetical protein
MLRSVSSRLGAGSIHLLKSQLQPVGEVVAGCACSLRCLVTSLPQLQQAEPAQQPEQPQKATTKQHLTPYNPDEGPGADSTIVHKHGADLLHDCVHNKVQLISSTVLGTPPPLSPSVSHHLTDDGALGFRG